MSSQFIRFWYMSSIYKTTEEEYVRYISEMVLSSCASFYYICEDSNFDDSRYLSCRGDISECVDSSKLYLLFDEFSDCGYRELSLKRDNVCVVSILGNPVARGFFYGVDSSYSSYQKLVVGQSSYSWPIIIYKDTLEIIKVCAKKDPGLLFLVECIVLAKSRGGSYLLGEPYGVEEYMLRDVHREDPSSCMVVRTMMSDNSCIHIIPGKKIVFPKNLAPSKRVLDIFSDSILYSEYMFD